MKSVAADVALRDAITKGNLRGVKRALKSGADVERVDERGWTPIMLAAKVGYVAILRLLVTQKRLADFRLAAAKRAKRLAKYIGDAVPAAAMRNQVKALRVLLNEFKADVNARYLNGIRPLMVTASHGHEDAIKFFLENGADIEAKTEDGITALHLAVLNGTADVVEVL
ncbi:ankyrin-2 isoform X16 [Phytophthora cinnamomi]|uniref:ankyrin-2 isoform X16 n=1 Tax=Phytophthora cinnamomi TaxID=4785 RepID=UPI00355A941F|nr:ankyrin-2 isoform X16 [Phytophthora cinnamomi]